MYNLFGRTLKALNFAIKSKNRKVNENFNNFNNLQFFKFGQIRPWIRIWNTESRIRNPDPH